MVTVSVYRDIQDYKSRGRSKQATAKELKLSRTTVRKFWSMSEGEFNQYVESLRRRTQRFDRYREEIIELVAVNESDGSEVYVSSVYDVLEDRHGAVPASARTLRNYIHMLRETGAIEKRRKTQVRRPQEEGEMGKQCQVDFGQTRIIGGTVVYIFAAILAASRARYVCVQDHPFRTQEVIRHLLACFRFFGGRPRELVIDQDKLMTVSERDGEIVHTADFQSFLDEQELGVWLCRKADPESKGKVENLVKFAKTSFFSARQFLSVEEIHEPLARWLARRANGGICEATGRVPQTVLTQEEQPALLPLRASIYDTVQPKCGERRLADEKAMISFRGNRYSVPNDYVGSTVGVREVGRHIVITDWDNSETIAKHLVPETKGQTIVAAHHRVSRGQKAEEVYAQLATKWDGEPWIAFLEANRSAFPRYWKEQATSLRRFLENATEKALLATAVQFCLEAETVGAGDLQYAYEHLVAAQHHEREPLLTHVKPILEARKKPSASVAKRKIGYYSSIISLIAGRVA